MRFCTVIWSVFMLLTVVSCDLEAVRIKQFFDSMFPLNLVDESGVHVQQLPRTSESDILNAISESNHQLKFPHSKLFGLSGSDDYPECGETVEKTAEHIIDSLLDYFYNKICKESKNEYIKHVCEYASAHEEAFRGWIVGYTDVYSKSFFYAAGKGKCDIHGHPFNMTSGTGMTTFNDLLNNIDDMYSDEIQAYVYSSDGIGCIHSEHNDIGMAINSLYGAADGKPDDDKCKKCYIGVVMKYISKVEELEKKFCAKTKCPYLHGLCSYLEEHDEFNKGLIAGIFRPFKFAAGYCIGNKECKHDHSNNQMTAYTAASYFAQKH